MLSSLLAIILPPWAQGQTVAEFKESRIYKILALQRIIDQKAPLNQATFFGTHNSYNSKAYRIPFIRYMDPNQELSISEQLELGIRSIELDAHWFYSSPLKKDILLCHGFSNHLGCSLFDRPLKSALQEIAAWLKDHKNEVVLLYIERHLDGQDARLADLLHAYLGPYIFTPRMAQQKPLNTLTKATLIKAGKSLLIISQGSSQSFGHSDLNDYVFIDPTIFIDANLGDISSLDCSNRSLYQDKTHQSLWRIYEDRTLYRKITSPMPLLTPKKLQALLGCKINWIALDKINRNDPRLSALIWSWVAPYPQAKAGRCAAYQNQQGIINKPCTESLNAFVCQASNGNFKIVKQQGIWQDGEKNCQRYAGKAWHFATPINAGQMKLLHDLAKKSDISCAWLNYSQTINGDWVA